MDGVRIEVSGSTATVVVEDASAALLERLRERIASYCYGAATVSEDQEYYSLERTVREFLERYDSKPPTTKLGMVGELLAHAVMPECHPELTATALFFNKEERNVKKGFDLTFHEGLAALWYGEVKAGEVVDPATADAKAAMLLQRAAADLDDKLGTGALRSRWDSALHDAAAILESPEARSVRTLLRADSTEITARNPIKKRAVLAAALLHSVDHCRVSAAATGTVAAAIAATNRFDALRILVIQKSAIETVVGFLRGLGDA